MAIWNEKDIMPNPERTFHIHLLLYPHQRDEPIFFENDELINNTLSYLGISEYEELAKIVFFNNKSWHHGQPTSYQSSVLFHTWKM